MIQFTISIVRLSTTVLVSRKRVAEASSAPHRRDLTLSSREQHLHDAANVLPIGQLLHHFRRINYQAAKPVPVHPAAAPLQRPAARSPAAPCAATAQPDAAAPPANCICFPAVD